MAPVADIISDFIRLLNIDAFMCKQHFTVVAAQGEAGF